jgi:hypothetical protein
MSAERDRTIALQRTIHLGQLLGEGGMGRVVEGYAVDPSQHLAVKMLHPEHADDREVGERFDEEVALMASIDHPGSLPIYGSGSTADGTRWYAMKKVEGRTFTELLADRESTLRSLPARHHLLLVLLDVCETVAFAHGAGIVHRDLKPDNILIDRHESVYVIDWGIAKRVGRCVADPTSRTLPGKVMGSPGYLAPEQAEGRSTTAGPQADVFALGAILYEILTGQRPFGGMGGREEMLGAIHRDPPHPRRIDWLLPRSISAVCMKALEKNPARRYADAGELAADLRAHLEGRAVSATRPGPVERLRYAARRKPVRAITAVAVVVALSALAAFVGIQSWVDERLADKSFERIEQLDAEIAGFRAGTARLREQLASDSLDPAERNRLDHELQIRNSRWLLTEFAALRTLGSVAELRFIRVDRQVEDRYRMRLFRLIETALERESPAFAAALIDTVLTHAEEQEQGFEWSAADLGRLRELSVRARRMAGLPENSEDP